MTEAVIVSAARTAIGRFGGALKDIPAPRLGAIAIKEAVRRSGVGAGDVNEAIMGCVLSAGLGQNPARQAMLGAGLPDSIGAYTVSKVCGSGLKAVMLAATAIRAGDASIIVAGGMESMTRAPYMLRDARYGYRLNNGELVDGMVFDGLWDVYNNFHMGMTGEIVAERYGITRQMADQLSLESHQKAIAAIKSGKFKDEVVPVEMPQKKGPPFKFEVDEGPREDTDLQKLGKLPAVFKKDGMVTAGNASQISDGAAAVVVMSSEEAKRRGIRPLARIVGYHTGGVRPEWVMEAPIPTVKALLDRLGMTVDDMNLIEHNEAFATASCAVVKELGVKKERFNVNGGAVALGHPIGASGCRVLVTLLYALKDRDLRRGLATLCLGGGNAVAMVVERE